jgi:16S rRNA processing protein RimM
VTAASGRSRSHTSCPQGRADRVAADARDCGVSGAATTVAALISLGRLVNPHATHGELRMLPFNPDSTTLGTGSTVVLRRGAEHQRRRVTAIRRHKRFLLLTLEGCTSMSAAEALVGYEVCVPETALPPSGPDEIYHYQLVGMAVVTTSGAEVGVVAEVLATAGNDVCVVRNGNTEHLIPLVANVVKEVSRDRRCLVIDPLPGLLD